MRTGDHRPPVPMPVHGMSAAAGGRCTEFSHLHAPPSGTVRYVFSLRRPAPAWSDTDALHCSTRRRR